MKRQPRRNRWQPAIPRPHKRVRNAVYPLKRATVTNTSGAGGQATRITPRWTSSPTRSRGVRVTSWLILLTIPLLLFVWTLSILAPVAIEARRAQGKIFQEPAPRVRFDQATPGALTPGAELTVPPTTTAAAPTATARPGDPTNTPAPPTPTPYPEWSGNEPINILLLGVDRRKSDVAPPRSDTMIVVRVDPVAKRVDMFSIPRDLLVDIPGFYATKINAAYPFGETSPESIIGGCASSCGPTLAAQTVELNFGIPINYFAEVDIAGMERIIDLLGGITIDVQGIIKDDQYPSDNFGYTRVYFTPGLQRMDGVTAVRYSRTRHDDGDFMRNRRQQQVLLAMRDQALETGVVSKLPDLIREIGDSFRTDLSPSKWLSVIRLAQGIDRSNIYTHSLVPYVTAQDINGGFFFVADWPSIRTLVSNLPSDPNARSGLEPQEAPAIVTPAPDTTPPAITPPAATPDGQTPPTGGEQYTP